MRIFLQGRATTGERRGGDASLVANLAGELEALGHEAVVGVAPPEAGLAGFDAVHAFNLDRSVLSETEAVAWSAVTGGRRLVVTPLWWPLDAYVADLDRSQRWRFRLGGLGAVRALRDRRLSSLAGVRRRQARILRVATVVAPSGDAEALALREAFGPLPVRVLRYGTHRSPPAAMGERSGVLCVARLDPRKNQLRLIRALEGTGIPLRLVGTSAVFPDYAKRCREAAGDLVELAGFLTEDDLLAALQAARVHALPSYFELPGLTSLDAAALGSAVVASRAGTAQDYLGDRACYCGTDVASIRQAVLEAYAAGPPPDLASYVATTFTWRAFAEGCLEAYAGTL